MFHMYRASEWPSKRRPTKWQLWKQMRPYGKWVCADGREVLFNRGYTPILERYPGQIPRAIPANMRIEWKKQSWFHDDGNVYDKETTRKIDDELRSWGLPPMAPKPKQGVWGTTPPVPPNCWVSILAPAEQ